MKAANLLPQERRRPANKVKLGGSFKSRQRGPREPRQPRESRQRTVTANGLGPLLVVAAALLGVLVIAVATVLEHNDVNDQKATLAALQSRVSAQQAAAARLTKHGAVIAEANHLSSLIQDIAGDRLNWYSALTGFGELITPNTYFTSLSYSGSGSASGSTSAAPGTSTGSTAPTFTLNGCTGSQDDVATVMREVRQIPGVVSVNESAGAGGVQLSTSSRDSTSKAAREGKPGSCADKFAMSVQFAAPTLENNGL